MFAKSVYHFFIFSVLWVPLLSASGVHVCLDPIQDDLQSVRTKLREAFSQQVIAVTSVTYTSDACVQQAEFDYLVDIHAGQSVAIDAIAQACLYLFKKEKFQKVLLYACEKAQGYALHFDLHAYWTFYKLKFQGILVGKEHYRQFYLMEPGDRFDQKKHADSIKKIQESFKKEGYFHATVTSSFRYNETTKDVTVRLHFKRGPRFSIDAVYVNLHANMLPDREKRELKKTIGHHLSSQLLHNTYTRELINAETKELKKKLAKAGYLHVDIELDEQVKNAQHTVSLHFTLHVQYKKTFYFSGNHFFSGEQLLDTLLVFGRSASLLPASILSEEVVKAYYAKGFWSVEIDPQEHDDAYHFHIKEGRRARIVDIELRNITCCDAERLKKNFFLPVLRKRYYDAEDVEQAVDGLMAYFLKQGYWEHRLLRHYFEPVDDQQNYKMICIFDEGTRSYLSSVTIEQFSQFEKQGPFKKYAHASQAVPFDINVIEEQRHWLQQELQRQGYYQPKIRPECNNDDGDIHLKWCIDADNAQVTFDKTVLLGSTTFPFWYIQRELDYRIGDAWHPDTLRHAISRLKRLEVFEAIHLAPDKDAHTPERVMRLKLQKDDPYELKMRTGLGVQHVTKTLSTGGLTYRLGGSFIYKNPTNAGDQFRIDADFTRAIRLVNAQYRRPWIFNVPIDGLFKGYTNRFEYPGFIGSQKNLYTVIQQGFLANFNTVRNNIDASVSAGFEVVDTFIDESTVDDFDFAQRVARAISFRPELLDKNIPFFQIQPTMMLYFLDNTVNPTRGSFSVLSAKGMFPISKLSSSDYFIRILAEQSFFIPLMPFVFAVRGRVGHIFHQEFSTIIPIERFYLGGANSIRSYETDQCPPLGVVCDVDGKDLFVPQGGRSLANLNLEARFPLYKQLGGVVFGDMGALSVNKLTQLKADDMLSGVGFGLRYNTPIGPLRFDFAWRIHKRDGVGRPYAWFLSFGNAFI